MSLLNGLVKFLFPNDPEINIERAHRLDMFIDNLRVHKTLIVKRLDGNNVFISHPYVSDKPESLAYYHLDLDTLIKTNISEETFKMYVSIPSDPSLIV